MKVYLLELEFYYKNTDNNETKKEVYSSLERAVEEGKYFFEEQKKIGNELKDKGYNGAELEDYSFYVTEIDLEYAEKFEGSIFWKEEDYLKREPTHIIYNFDANRKTKKETSCIQRKTKKVERSSWNRTRR